MPDDVLPELITRREARILGRKRYFTGKPCSKGHIAERLIASKKCIICNYERLTRWQNEFPDRKQQAEKRWRAGHQEQVKTKNTTYYADHAEELRTYSQQYRLDHPEEVKTTHREWRINNREHLNEYRRLRYDPTKSGEKRRRELETNPEHVRARGRAKARRRRARKAGAIGSHTPAETAALLELQNGNCAYCGINIRDGYTEDHKIPLVRGGSDDIENIALACLSCNDSKGTKTVEEWIKIGTRRRGIPHVPVTGLHAPTLESPLMIKAIVTDETGRTVLMIGLSFGNLAKFKAAPLDSHIKIDGKAMGLPIDVMLFSGETENDMGRFFADKIGPDTKVHIDPKLAT